MYIGYWYGYHMGFALGPKRPPLSTHRAFSGEACQFLFVLLCPTCLRLLSTGPWSPGSWGACSGSVLALRLGMEEVVLGTSHPAPILLAVTRFPSKVVKNNTSKRAPKSAQKTPKGFPAGARKVSRISTKPTFSANMPCAFDIVKTILFSRFRFATPPQNLKRTARKTDDA